jgi:glyoxylase-like metal-dependent hydrolase (beta-lactamase superfamily II)
MSEAPQLPPPVISVTELPGGVKVHTFLSPEAFLGNATHIIESAHALVLVDGQFIVPFSSQYRAYADGLGKPIDRVFLTHAHVDHFFGLGASFADVPIYALPETAKFLQANGEQLRAARQKEYGPFVADKVAYPTNEVPAGDEQIDGITYRVDPVTDTETDYMLTIQLPELGAYIVGDLIYSGGHVYITQNTEHWIAVLQGVKGSAATVFLAGHGPVADAAEVQTNIDYLGRAAKLFADNPTDPAAYKAGILAAYPNRTGAAILDIYIPRLYGQAPPE